MAIHQQQWHKHLPNAQRRRWLLSEGRREGAKLP